MTTNINYSKFTFIANLIMTVILFTSLSFAQLTGVKAIPGDYPSINSAVTALNLQGVGTGGVTFNVAAGHNETSSNIIIAITSNQPTATNPIVFQKSGVGANPLITAAPGVSSSLDGIIILSGTDYITFDGIDLLDPPSNTGDAMMEWGFALLRASSTDGCQNVVIKNCTITLQKINVVSSSVFSIGIYAANRDVTGATVNATEPTGQNSYNTFFGNNISNVYRGIVYVSSSTARDVDNQIGVFGEQPNNITNWGGGNQTTEGIRCEGQINVKISNNIINGGAGSTTFVHGIIATLFGTSANAANYEISHNRLTISGGSSNLQYVIRALASGDTVRINDNIIENCTTFANSDFRILSHEGTSNAVFIHNNIVRNNLKTSTTGIMYGIGNTSSVVNAEIYNNEVYNNSNGGIIHGINITGGTRVSVFGNKIYNIASSSSGTAFAVGGVTSASGPLNSYIYNNFISDLRANFSSAVDAVRGINITSTTANSNIGVYFNTIYLNSVSSGGNFGTSGIFHTFNTTATTAKLDMRNNIVVNSSTSNGTGKTAAFRRSSATNLNNYADNSNNNSFYAGIPGINNVIYFDGTNSDETIEAFKTRVSPRETFSITENVPFVNTTTLPYDLHVRTDVSTQTESGAAPVTSPIVITTDIDGDIRNAVSPDIGADEFNGIGSDITPPSISYTLLDHTLSTANRTLSNVAILDLSGVNVAQGTAPRIYYKRVSDNNTFVDNTPSTNGWKYTQTSSTNSPFEFTIDYSLLFSGTSVQMGDTVQYFVVAQDLADPANVGISEGTFASQPSSVNLTSAAFPLTGSINFYRIIILLNGVITVGDGGNYPNLTGTSGLFTLFNENIVNGNVIAQIVSDIIEPGTVALNQWIEQGAGNYILNIQPNAAVIRTMSGSNAGGLFRLNGADRVEIDGRFNGSGKYLTFENTNAASNTATIQLISLGAGQGSGDITIRNCNIKAGANNLSNVFGIFGGSSTGSISTGNAGGADLDNIFIIENNISKCRTGLFIRGTSSDQMQNLVVSGNKLGSDFADEYITEYGIYVGFADAPQVTENEVYNMIFEVSKWGIYFTNNVNNARVSKNKIHSIKQPGTVGYNSVGIVFFSATGCFDNTIDNNMIYDLSTYGNTSMYLVGIRIAGGSGYKVYYNSVSINDVIGNPATGLVSSCLFISTATTDIDIRNNIFLNTRTGNDPKNYAVFSPNTTTFTNLNNNNYWTSGNFFGYFSSDIANFEAWKTATGQDNDSYNVDPLFTSSTDLHINSGLTPTPLESGGTLIAGIDYDIDGDFRPGPVGSVNGGATAPDIGADEFDGVPFMIPDTVYVNVFNNFFDPADFTIEVGKFIKWTLIEGAHTTSSNIIPPGAASWDYTFTSVGDSYIYEVTVPGRYNYECLLHPGMIGAFTAVNALPFVEEFVYPAGEFLTDHGWTNHSGTGSFITLAAGSLTYTGYPSSGIGNHVVIEGGSGSREDVNTGFVEQNNDGDDIYYSFLVNVVSASAAADYFIHLGDRVSPTAFTTFSARLFVQDVAGSLRFGLSNTSTATMGTTNFIYGTTYLVLVKYTINTAGADETKLWVFSSGVPADELSAGVPEVHNTTTSGQDVIDAIALRQGSNAYSVQLDGLRVSTNWLDLVIPVELLAFTASVTGSSVSLIWSTASEINNLGFDIERKDKSSEWEKIGFVAGYGTTTETQTYSFIDKDIRNGIYGYRLKQIDYDGTFEYSRTIEVEINIPETFELSQNYPNPFNPKTVIGYQLPVTGNVTLKVYDVLGSEVATLVDEYREAGRYEITFDASGLASGLYIYQLKTNKFTSTKKMLMLK